MIELSSQDRCIGCCLRRPLRVLHVADVDRQPHQAHHWYQGDRDQQNRLTFTCSLATTKVCHK